MSGRGTGGMGCGNVVWPERFSRNIDHGADCLPDQLEQLLYIALCSNYGDASDAGAISVFCIKDGPFVTMMVLGVSGGQYSLRRAAVDADPTADWHAVGQSGRTL